MSRIFVHREAEDEGGLATVKDDNETVDGKTDKKRTFLDCNGYKVVGGSGTLIKLAAMVA